MSVFLRYLGVGVLNTFVGFGVIFGLTYLGVLPELANALGYCVGICFSYCLNRVLTFKERFSSKSFFKFVFAMGVSYGVNLLVLLLCLRILEWNVYLSQTVAGVSYTLSGFLLSRFFVWNPKNKPSKA